MDILFSKNKLHQYSFDKWDVFVLVIVLMSYFSSNIPSSMLYSLIGASKNNSQCSCWSQEILKLWSTSIQDQESTKIEADKLLQVFYTHYSDFVRAAGWNNAWKHNFRQDFTFFCFYFCYILFKSGHAIKKSKS